MRRTGATSTENSSRNSRRSAVPLRFARFDGSARKAVRVGCFDHLGATDDEPAVAARDHRNHATPHVVLMHSAASCNVLGLRVSRKRVQRKRRETPATRHEASIKGAGLRQHVAVLTAWDRGPSWPKVSPAAHLARRHAGDVAWTVRLRVHRNFPGGAIQLACLGSRVGTPVHRRTLEGRGWRTRHEKAAKPTGESKAAMRRPSPNIWVLLAIVGVMAMAVFLAQGPRRSTITYSVFLEQIEKGNVLFVQLGDQEATGVFQNPLPSRASTTPTAS